MNPNQGTQTEAMYAAAMEFAAEKASISYVQRKCRCSYNDAERMLERMVSEGIIETYGGRKTVATTPSQPAAPQGGAEAPKVYLSVNQLLQAIEFATGGAPANADELETSIGFQIGHSQDDDGKVIHGMRCWLADYPEEGVYPLDEEPTAKDLAAHALRASHGQAPAGAADDDEVDLPDAEDMAHSALQEALSFGLSHDVIYRWMRAIQDQTVKAMRTPTAQAAPAAATMPHATLADLHEGLAAKLHDGPARNLHLETAAALRAPAAGAVAGPTSAHIAAMERAWLWMDNQADSQSKGGHATFDLLMLREERDALRAAIDMEVTATCPHCNGAGEVFGHAENCTDDLCALNGDEHSCAGQVEPCQCAAAPTPAAQADSQPAPVVGRLSPSKEWLESRLEIADDSGVQAGVPPKNARPCDAPPGCNSHNCLECNDYPRAARAPADGVTAPAGGAQMSAAGERLLFREQFRHLELDEVPDAWGRPQFKHSHVDAIWHGWRQRAAIALLDAPPAQADSMLEDAALLHYALADGGNQSMNWQDVYDDWSGEGYFIDALRAAYKQDAARKQGGA